MSNERINNPDSAEFAQICMKWLKSNEPTLTVKDGKRITLQHAWEKSYF